jgi:hypothetical protein
MNLTCRRMDDGTSTVASARGTLTGVISEQAPMECLDISV